MKRPAKKPAVKFFIAAKLRGRTYKTPHGLADAIACDVVRKYLIRRGEYNDYPKRSRLYNRLRGRIKRYLRRYMRPVV